MNWNYIDIVEGALRMFIEECLQSPKGPSKKDLAYIEAERKYIRELKNAAQPA